MMFQGWVLCKELTDCRLVGLASVYEARWAAERALIIVSAMFSS